MYSNQRSCISRVDAMSKKNYNWHNFLETKKNGFNLRHSPRFFKFKCENQFPFVDKKNHESLEKIKSCSKLIQHDNWHENKIFWRHRVPLGASIVAIIEEVPNTWDQKLFQWKPSQRSFIWHFDLNEKRLLCRRKKYRALFQLAVYKCESYFRSQQIDTPVYLRLHIISKIQISNWLTFTTKTYKHFAFMKMFSSAKLILHF